MASSREETAAILETKRRSYRWHPPTYAPSLVFSHGKKYRDQTFCTLFDGACHDRSIPEMRGMRFVGASPCYGWLILQSYYSTESYLFNPVSYKKIHLPPLINSSFRTGSLTSSPSDPNCFIVLYSEKMKSIIFCRVKGGSKWIERQLKCQKKNRALLHDCQDVISCNGKIYLQFGEVIFVVDVLHDAFASVEFHETKLLQDSIPEARSLTIFSVESLGDIFEVRVIHLGKVRKIIRKIDVLKLDLSSMDWVKVETLGDRIFLLGSSSISLSSVGLGVKGNRIYLTLPGFLMLYMFDMDDETVTTTLPCSREFSQWGEPFWMLPDCELQECKGVAELEQTKDEGGWKDLPTELLQLILSSLSLGDLMRFHLTCKTWMSLAPQLRSNLPIQSNSGAPWLMYYTNITEGICDFYHPIYGDIYTKNIPQLADAIIRDAKHGWLLMSRGTCSIFFFNPLTLETIKLPDVDYRFVGISFSSPPTSSDFVVFGLRECSDGAAFVLVYGNCNASYAQSTWSTYCFSLETHCDFRASHCNPVFCDGNFYVLSQDGKLGIFNPNETEDELLWQVLPIAPVFSYSGGETTRSFLMECDGEILSVFVNFRGKPVWIYKLDRSRTTKWITLESLGDKVMFLSPAASTLQPSRLRGIENRIYFSKFHEANNMFYSLSTNRYHCFKCICCRGDCKSVREHGNCTWIQLAQPTFP